MLFDEFRQTFLAVPPWSWVVQFVGLVSAYVGAELNACMRIKAFYLWLASNVALAIVHAASSLWLLLVLNLLFFRVNLLGIRRWSRR